jgi:hypothetical protein
MVKMLDSELELFKKVIIGINKLNPNISNIAATEDKNIKKYNFFF